MTAPLLRFAAFDPGKLVQGQTDVVCAPKLLPRTDDCCTWLFASGNSMFSYVWQIFRHIAEEHGTKNTACSV